MSEIRVKSTGTIKLFESDNTSHVTIASPASLSANRTITIPDADVTLGAGTTINNNADNKVITGSGTANTLEGETNFIYNGNRMGVGGAGASVDLGDGIHIKTADAGGGSVDANGSELVIENSTNAGITILTPNNSKGNIYFADPQSADTGVLRYDHSDNSMRFVNNGLENFRIVSTGNVGIGEPSPLGKLHVRTADSGASVDGGANELVIEGSGDVGLSILSGTSGEGSIYFGDSGNNNIGYMAYRHASNSLNFATNGTADSLVINSAGIVNKPLNPSFRVYQSSNTDYAPDHTMYNQNITEVWDVNSDMGTNGSFTAPVTGKYLFTIGAYDVNASESTSYDMMLVTSNRTHRWGNRMKYRNDYTGYTNMKLEGTIIADMDANDTAYVKCGSSVTMTNGGNQEHSYYSGNLLG